MAHRLPYSATSNHTMSGAKALAHKPHLEVYGSERRRNIATPRIMAALPPKKQNRDKIRTRKDGVAKLPQKKYFRQRAHANPFSDHALE